MSTAVVSTTVPSNVVVFHSVNASNIVSVSAGNYATAAQNVAGLMGSSLPSQSIALLLPALENYNLLYTEKQVRRIDENFSDYHTGIRLRVIALPPPLPRRLRNLIQKSFSGDVSGSIGEALFAYYLLDILGVPANRFAHLRPEKRRKRATADFLVLNNGGWLNALVGANQSQVAAEVKSSTGQMPTDRIEHALEQLYMTLGVGDRGILFLVCRNDPQSGYECYLVPVRRL